MIWNIFTNTFYLISFFTGPIMLAFEFETFDRQRYFELFLDFIMLCDIATEFFTSRMHKGKKITKLKSIAKAYIKSNFIFDILACLPGLVTWERYTVLYYLKVFRYLQIKRLFDLIDLVVRKAKARFLNNTIAIFNIHMICTTSFIMMLLFHTLSCIWIYISGSEDGGWR